ncbi:MAG: hypothetical protein WCB02_29710 [Bradyrhizobium sp.]
MPGDEKRRVAEETVSLDSAGMLTMAMAAASGARFTSTVTDGTDAGTPRGGLIGGAQRCRTTAETAMFVGAARYHRANPRRAAACLRG